MKIITPRVACVIRQGSLAVEEAKLARAVDKLHLHQISLDEKETEIAEIRVEYDEAMCRRQVRLPVIVVKALL